MVLLAHRSRWRTFWIGFTLSSLSLLFLGAGSSTSAQDQSTQAASWWAFQPFVRNPVPEVDDPRWNQHPIDAFIKNKLDEQGLIPARRADKRTLIRRLYLDLIGLLPSPAEVALFVTDESPDA